MASDLEQLSPARDVSMAEEWFDFATPDHFLMDWRFRVFLQQTKWLPENGARILEIGCGAGLFLRQLNSLQKHYVLEGCDLNASQLARVDQATARAFVYDICERAKQLEGIYDAVLLMDVVEHIPDDVDFLRCASFHARPGGIVFVNVPASMSLFSRYDEVVGHKRRYDATSLERVFREAGLECIEIIPWGWLLYPIAVLRKFAVRNVSDEKVIHTGFVPPGKLAHAALHSLKALELALPFRSRVGTSLLAIGRKV